MANLFASSILGNSCREFPPLNIVNDDEFPVFYIHTSSLEPYKNLVPILIAGRVEKISKISDKDFSSYKAVLSVSSGSNVINSETPLSFLKIITTLKSSYYFKGIVERNSKYYGNSNILIDSNFNVLYLSCYNRETSHTVFLVNKEALISYGALSKAILGSLITSLSASYYLETSFALAEFPNEAGDPKVYSKLDNITIVNETDINSFISRFPLLDSNVTDEYITESIKQRFDLNKIMDNMFLG